MKLKETLNLGKTDFPYACWPSNQRTSLAKGMGRSKTLPTSSRIEPRKTTFHLCMMDLRMQTEISTLDMP